MTDNVKILIIVINKIEIDLPTYRWAHQSDNCIYSIII